MGAAWSAQRIRTAINLGFLDRSRYFFIQVAPHLSSRGWVDPVPDTLLLRKSGGTGNRTRDLWACNQEPRPRPQRRSFLLYTAPKETEVEVCSLECSKCILNGEYVRKQGRQRCPRSEWKGVSSLPGRHATFTRWQASRKSSRASLEHFISNLQLEFRVSVL
jgi:hypothetical protein